MEVNILFPTNKNPNVSSSVYYEVEETIRQSELL